LDTVSFVISFGFLWLVRPLPAPAAEHQPTAGLRSILAGFSYARGRQDLLGSYLADLAAMTLAYPAALYPFVAANLHAPWATGLMFAAPSAGALVITVVSGWMGRVRRHGLAIAISAAAWGLLITAFGLAPDIWAALGFLVLAGAADMVSGIFRDTLWNQTIPDRLRGQRHQRAVLHRVRRAALRRGGRRGLPAAARLHPLPGSARRSRGGADLTGRNPG
jgi:hypothetical protein